ncbi:hypothetical protein DY000_02052486 [Brassica cretica]|nr:hypothetical protein DY000_02052486 [Brassica cretica]
MRELDDLKISFNDVTVEQITIGRAELPLRYDILCINQWALRFACKEAGRINCKTLLGEELLASLDLVSNHCHLLILCFLKAFEDVSRNSQMSIVYLDEVGDEVTHAGYINRYYIRHAEWWLQTVFQETYRVVETTWMQDAELE